MEEAPHDQDALAVIGFSASADAASEVTDGSYQEAGEKSSSGADESSDDDDDDYHINPMQKLQKAALELADLTAERAFAIDRINIHQKFDEYTVGRLTEIFYDKVYSDPDEWFRGMFTSPLKDAAGNLGDYILQRIGGPAYYSDRKGFPAVMHRHMVFNLTPRAAERWLEYMEQALEDAEIGEITSAKQRSVLLDFLRYTAFFLVAAQNHTQQAIERGAEF